MGGDTFRRHVHRLASGQVAREASWAIGQAMLRCVRREFEESRGPDGKSWAPLALRQGKPMSLTGQLQDSYRILEITRTAVTIGSHLARAAWLTRGFTAEAKKARALMLGDSGLFRKKVTIPARPVLPNTRDLPKDWLTEIKAAVREALMMP